MPVWLVSLLSVAVGGVLAYLGSLHIHTRAERAAARRDRVDSLSRFLGVLTRSVVFLSGMPDYKPGLIARRRDEVARRWVWLGASDWVNTHRRIIETFGDQPWRTLDELMDAYAELSLRELTPEVRRAVDDAVEYVCQLGESRAPELRDRWPQVRGTFLEAVRRSGDAAGVAQALGTPSTSEVAQVVEEGSMPSQPSA